MKEKINTNIYLLQKPERPLQTGDDLGGVEGEKPLQEYYMGRIRLGTPKIFGNR